VDLEQILEYSWERFPATTERFGNDILNHIEILKTLPNIGSPVAEQPQVRQLLHTPIAIYYQVHEAPNYIEILHIWHVSRKPPQFAW
jgi:plasmid stabilization system protein ParE